MRIVRPGTVVGPQQQYMYLKQLEWAKWAAVDEMKKAQAAQAAAASVAPSIVTPATPPAEADEEDEPMQTTPTRPSIDLPPVTPSRHIAAAAAKAKEIAPPGQPRKTPNAKRVAPQDSDEEDEEADVLPALGVAPVARRVKPAPSRGVTASEQRPSRVTRSTAGAAAIKKIGTGAAATTVVPESPAKTSRQGPNKIPRLATTRTTSAAKALAAAANAQPQPQTRQLRNAPPPTPSRLPTLASAKRLTHVQHTNSLTDVGNLKRPVTAASSDAWVANNVAAVMVPATKSERPGLRSVRRRRSSFSSADVVA